MSSDPTQTTVWSPESTAPTDRWVRTHREGEMGYNVCRLRVWPEGDREWIDRSGRTTVTHGSFAAPTHWMELDFQPERLTRCDLYGHAHVEEVCMVCGVQADPIIGRTR